MTKRRIVILGGVFFIDLSSLFLLSSLYFILSSLLFVFYSILLLLLVMQDKSVCFSFWHVYVVLVYSLNVSLAGWTPAQFYGLGSNTVMLYTDWHTNAPWYRHFRATCALCPVYVLCFSMHWLLRSAWSTSSYFCAPLSLSLSLLRTSSSFICDNRTRTWLIQDKIRH